MNRKNTRYKFGVWLGSKTVVQNLSLRMQMVFSELVKSEPQSRWDKEAVKNAIGSTLENDRRQMDN